MFRIVKDTKIPFLSIRRRVYLISITLLIVGVVSVAMKGGLELGVDFAGGRLFEYRFSETIQAEELRSILEDVGVAGGEVQEVGDSGLDFMIRIPVADQEVRAQDAGSDGPSALFVRAVAEAHPGISADLRREELVGPRVGAELRKKAFYAISIALFLILLYVAFRFQVKFGVGGVVALAHDVLVTVIIFSFLGIEFTIPIVAALLTIGGYSINDTVVVFDRIREQSKYSKGELLEDVMNRSINMTLGRTLVTSITTLLAAGSLYFLGGEVLHDFALAILIGIAVGTYSSIYVASAIALEMSGKDARVTHEEPETRPRTVGAEV